MITRIERESAAFLLLGLLLTACATATHTPSAKPKATVTATPERVSTLTVAPNVTTTQTATTPVTPLQSSYDLPSWMSKPKTNIVATITNWQNHIFQFSFFGESVDQRYDMSIPESIKGYFWQDASHFGFLDQGKTAYILDLQSGKTSQQAITDKSLRFVQDLADKGTPTPLMVSKPVSENQGFFFVFAYQRNEFSNDWKYHAFSGIGTGDDTNTVIENTETGETYTATSQTDHLWDITFKWSYNSPPLLGILQSNIFPEQPVHGNQITVINPAKQETIGRYADDYTYTFEWSPDGQKFLFGRLTSAAPCIFDRQENKHSCAHLLPKINPKGGFGMFKWSADQKNILFEYYTVDLNYHFSGHFCRYQLESGASDCPTEGNETLKDWAITDYQLSPDGRYVILQLECRVLGMDAACSPRHALMILDGKDFRILDESYYENIGYIGTEELLWRPIP